MSDDTDVVEVVVADTGAEMAVLRARLVQSELKAAAIRAGMVDLDGIKLIDMNQVALNAGGEVADGVAVMAALRAAKPYLFGARRCGVGVGGGAAAPRSKAAMEMSVEEWRTARAALLRQR
jgi:hypothetical protein